MPRHGLSRSKVYKVWANIVQSENHVKAWRTFAKFHSDVGDPPSENCIFARLDTKRQHGPNNFEWRERDAHAKMESDRRTRKIAGKTYEQWSEKTGVPVDTIKRRIRRGWDPVKAAKTPLVPKTAKRPRKKAEKDS